jgi:hypothetical protein
MTKADDLLVSGKSKPRFDFFEVLLFKHEEELLNVERIKKSYIVIRNNSPSEQYICLLISHINLAFIRPSIVVNFWFCYPVHIKLLLARVLCKVGKIEILA